MKRDIAVLTTGIAILLYIYFFYHVPLTNTISRLQNAYTAYAANDSEASRTTDLSTLLQIRNQQDRIVRGMCIDMYGIPHQDIPEQVWEILKK